MKSFRLEKIKSFKDSGEIELRPITIFAGKNSSGKSALVRFPVIIKQSYLDNPNNPILLNGIIDYGNFKDVVHDQTGNFFSYEISFNSIEISEDAYLNGDNKIEFDIINLKFKIKYENNTILLDEFCLSVDNQKLICISENKAELFAFYNYKEENAKFVKLQPSITFAASFQKKTDVLINTNKINISNNNILQTIHWIKSLQINKLITDFSDNLIYISSFREIPKRNYRISDSIFNNVGISGENTATLLKQSIDKKTKLLTKVSEWILETFGYKVEIASFNSNYFQIKVQHNNKKIKENIIDVGSGIAQILPIITQIFFNKEKNIGKTFIIEEPEIHLHPNAQVKLAELFAEIALITKSTIIIETHSEHIIRKLQSIVANQKNEFNKNDIIIYQTDLDNQGTSTIDRIELNEKGQFLNKWKSGFFDQAYKLSKELIANVSKST